ERLGVAKLKGRREIKSGGGPGDCLDNLSPAMASIAAPEPRSAVEDRTPVGALIVDAARRDELARVRLEGAIGGKGHPECRQRIIFTLHSPRLLRLDQCA